MNITTTLKLSLTNSQKDLLENHSKLFVDALNYCNNELLKQSDYDVANIKNLSYSSADLNYPLPSVVKAQVIRKSKTFIKFYLKDNIYDGELNTLPKAKKPIYEIPSNNTKNYKVIDSQHISLPFWVNNKCTRIILKMCKGTFSKYIEKLYQMDNLGTIRIVKKNNKWLIQFSCKFPDKPYLEEGNILGVDLGIKIPATCVTSNNKVKLVGNGRENKYIRRKFSTKRKQLQKAKKFKTLKKINNKEQRIMKDRDHKYSREIINFALKNNCKEIRLENLQGIRKSTSKSRKNNKSIHNWSFYRLAMYIEYKAELKGIKVTYVNPSYTSQICPKCSKLNKATDRKYICNCGYKNHRDIVGAINIIKAPIMNGKSS